VTTVDVARRAFAPPPLFVLRDLAAMLDRRATAMWSPSDVRPPGRCPSSGVDLQLILKFVTSDPTARSVRASVHRRHLRSTGSSTACARRVDGCQPGLTPTASPVTTRTIGADHIQHRTVGDSERSDVERPGDDKLDAIESRSSKDAQSPCSLVVEPTAIVCMHDTPRTCTK